jgi:hypothetical protein
VRAERKPVSRDNPFLAAEKRMSTAIIEALDAYRDSRDGAMEKMFKAIWESPFAAAAVGFAQGVPPPGAPRPIKALQQEVARLRRAEAAGEVAEGTVLDGLMRVLLYVGRDAQAIDERPFEVIRRIVRDLPPEKRPGMVDLREAVRRQFAVLRADEEGALAALPGLLPGDELRRKVVAASRRIGSAMRGELTAGQAERLARVEKVLGVAQSAK